MIDLNDVWQPPVRYDLAAIRERLAATAADWLPELFPQARLSSDRKTLRCADLSGRPPRNEGSCVIHLRGPARRLGLRSCDRRVRRPDRPDPSCDRAGRRSALFEEAARLARMDAPVSADAPRADSPTTLSRSPAFSMAASRSPASSAETYLRSRGLSDPGSPDLLFHPDLTDFDTKRGWSGMVAVVRDGAGEPTGGIHRTFLLDDGSAKAPPGKKMLGPSPAARFGCSPIGDDGHLGIAEGIETALVGAARSSACRPGRRCPPTVCGAGSGRQASAA